ISISESTPVLAVAGVVLLALLLWRQHHLRRQPYRLERIENDDNTEKTLRRVPVPSPPSTHWLWGNTLDAMKYQKPRWHEWLKEESDRVHNQPWLLSIMGTAPTLVLSSPEAFEDVLQKQPDVFLKGPAKCELLRDFMGEGIIAVDGALWQLQRKRTAHLLASASMTALMEESIQDKAKVLCQVLDKLGQAGASFSLKRLLQQLTCDIFARVGFGIELNCMHNAYLAATPSSHPFLQSMADTSRVLQARMQQPTWLWKLKRYLDIGQEKVALQGHQAVHDLPVDGRTRKPYRLESSLHSDNTADKFLCRVALPVPPSTHWLWGNTLDAMKYQKPRWHEWLKEESDRVHNQPWLLSIMGTAPTLVLSSPEAFEDVLQKQPDVFLKGPAKCELLRDFFGEGIVAVDGEAWRRQRRRTTQLLVSPRMMELMERVIQDKTRVLCQVLDKLVASRQAFGLKVLMKQLTSDIFGQVGFGIDLHCLERANLDAKPSMHPFLQSLAPVGVVLQARMHQPTWLWKLKRWANIGVEKTARKCVGVMHDMIVQTMTEQQQQLGETRKNLLTVFLDQEAQESVDSNGDCALDPALVRDMALSFFGAGQGTTSEALAWVFVMLNRHPDLVTKLRAELEEKLPDLVGAQRNGCQPGEIVVPTGGQVQGLTFMEAFLRESMRLNGMALTTRMAMQDTTLNDAQKELPNKRDDGVVVVAFRRYTAPTS
ncbi:TPA: LOW QUALITY PROTEIN: hypothetical protein N0F65_002719, partial [Lagenidium giganteum]